MRDRLKVFSGRSNPTLAKGICEILGIGLGAALVDCFSDGEIRVEIHENVRGRDVFVVQSTCYPVNLHLVETLLMVDALKRASARRINVVMPYYGYGRRDQKDKPRVPITAKMVANLMTTAGAGRLISFDLHAGQIQGFFKIPVDDVPSLPVLAEDFKARMRGDEVVVAPDAEGVRRARAFAERLDLPLAIIHRTDPDEGRSSTVVGSVKHRRVVILDDMVDTGRTVCEAAWTARREGATTIESYCVHPVLSAGSVEMVDRSPLDMITVTDTIPTVQKTKESAKFRVVSVAPILAEVIKRVHDEVSISCLFL